MSEKPAIIEFMEEDVKTLLITRRELGELMDSEEFPVKTILNKMFEFMKLSHTITGTQLLLTMQHISSLKEWDDVQKDVMETLLDSFVPIVRAWD